MTDFKWSIYGGGRIMEFEYHYIGIVWQIIWDLSKAIGMGEGRSAEVVG